MSNTSLKYDIEIFNMSKVYNLKGKGKSIAALKNINLKVNRGEIFGLLGPNGAGKTTLVSILTTLIQPTSGYAIILGHNILKDAWFVKENVGLMLGGEMIYHRLTGYKNLKFYCKLYGIKDYQSKIKNLAEIFDLTEWLNQYVGKYSKGMKLKLALARILLIEPKILFLDEPMLGLDPVSVNQTITLLKNLNTTIFLTSHQMDIVAKLCDRIAFLKQGKIIKIDTQDNFRRLISDKIKIKLKILKKRNNLIEILKKLEYVSDVNEINNDVIFYIDDESYYPKIFNILKDFSIVNFNELKPSLDEVFIKLSE